jgi:hypothetical protein
MSDSNLMVFYTIHTFQRSTIASQKPRSHRYYANERCRNSFRNNTRFDESLLLNKQPTNSDLWKGKKPHPETDVASKGVALTSEVKHTMSEDTETFAFQAEINQLLSLIINVRICL